MLSNLVFMVDEAHDPPLEGMHYYRVPREESYVKDFKPLNAGQIFLQKGKGRLAITTLYIPGTMAIDFDK